MSELSLSSVPDNMQEKSLEVIGLEARNEKLRHNIDTLETENTELKSEASSLKEEIGRFTKKIVEIERKNRRLHTTIESLDENYKKLLDTCDEIKNKKKDGDDKVSELKKQVESQKSELDKAHEEIETQKKNEQCENTVKERLSKSRTEKKELASNITSLEEQNADLKKQLDKMEKKCETLRRHNKFLTSNGIKKTQMKDEGQGSDDNINENFSEDKRDEPLIELEESQEPQDRYNEMSSEFSGYRNLSPSEETFPGIEKGDEIEIENSNTNLRNVLGNSESCENLYENLQFSRHEEIGDTGSEEQKSMIEASRSTIHSLMCRWIDVEINFIQELPVLIFEAIILIWALIRFVAQYLYLKWEVFISLGLSSFESSSFFNSLWIYSQLTKYLFKIHILPNSISKYIAGKKFQQNYELIRSDEPASDQEISCGSRHSSFSLMPDDEIEKMNSLQCHSPKNSNLDSFSCLGKPVSSSYSSTNDSQTYEIIRLPGLQKSNSEFASSSEPLKGESSVNDLLFKLVSLLFFAPVRTGAIKKQGTISLNPNSSLPPPWNTWSRRSVFLPSRWLTMIEMFTHFGVYAIIYIVWLQVLRSFPPQYSSYYAPAYGYNHLHGWAHQLYFTEQWASKLERFSFQMITMFGVQVKNFPMPG